MRTHGVTAAVLTLSVLFATPTLAQDTAEELYQAGLYQEEVQGNLERAVDLFGRILIRFPDNRAVGAKAQLHIGLCYEKLGQREAEQAYRRVIADFPEHAAEVAVARSRLAEIRRSAAELSREPTFQKVEIASRPQNGVLSPDGTKLAFVASGSVWVVPLHGPVRPDMTGEPLRLTEPMGAWDMGNQLAWSGDGNWIAFNATPDDVEEIHVVAADGSRIKKIPGAHPRYGHAYNFRLSLSDDGGTLAFVHAEPEGSPMCGYRDGLSIHTIPVDGRQPGRLTENCTVQPAYSPDGTRLAYTKTVAEDTTLIKQLWVTSVDRSTPTLLLDSTQVRGPVWSPDGDMIAVIHEPGPGNESREVWIVPASADEGPVEPIARIDLPRVTLSLLAGWTPAGELGVHMVASREDALYTVPSTGGRAVQITPDGGALFPRWSPDGRSVVFRGAEGLRVVPAEGGESSLIALQGDSLPNPGIPPGGGVHVSPDGGTVVFAGIRFAGDSAGYEQDIWTVPIGGGVPTRITRSPASDRFPCWAPDGNEIAFLRPDTSETAGYGVVIYSVPAAGGDPRRVSAASDSVAWATFAYSPDGEHLAYFSTNNQLRIIPVGGGGSTVVAEVKDAGRHSELAWSPDGRSIAYDSGGKVWTVSSDGGAPVELATGLRRDAWVRHLAWSPDGDKIVFRAFTGGQSELWLITDFLPSASTARGSSPDKEPLTSR